MCVCVFVCVCVCACVCVCVCVCVRVCVVPPGCPLVGAGPAPYRDPASQWSSRAEVRCNPGTYGSSSCKAGKTARKLTSFLQK